jgi:hypothetical protein
MTSAITSFMNSTALLPSSAPSAFPILHSIDVLVTAPLPPSEYPSPFQAVVKGSRQPTIFFAEPIRFWDQYEKVVAGARSDVEKEANSLQPKYAHEASGYYRNQENQWLVNRRFEGLEKASQEYETRANVKPLIHPADRAVLLARARVAKEQLLVDFGYPIPEKGLIKQQIEEIRLEEAKACEQVAALATEPLEKLVWLQTGIAALSSLLKLDDYGYAQAFDYSLIAQQQLEQGSLLYHKMGELFVDESFLITGEHLLPIFQSSRAFDLLFPDKGAGVPMRFVAATCFKRAGQMAEQQAWLIYDSLGNEGRKALPTLPWESCYEQAFSHFKRALGLLRSIDLSGPFFTNDQRLGVQHEVIGVVHGRWRRQFLKTSDGYYPCSDVLVYEWQKMADIRFQCALAQPTEYGRRYHLIEQSKALAEAAYRSSSPKQSYKLYMQAYEVVLNNGLDKTEAGTETRTSEYLTQLPKYVETAKLAYEASLKENSASWPKLLWNAALCFVGLKSKN